MLFQPVANHLLEVPQLTADSPSSNNLEIIEEIEEDIVKNGLPPFVDPEEAKMFIQRNKAQGMSEFGSKISFDIRRTITIGSEADAESLASLFYKRQRTRSPSAKTEFSTKSMKRLSVDVSGSVLSVHHIKRRPEPEEESPKSIVKSLSVWESINFSILKLPLMWLLILSDSCFGLLYFNFSMLFTLYTINALGYTKENVSYLLMIYAFADLAGRLLVAFLGDRTQYPKKYPLMLTFLINAACNIGKSLTPFWLSNF